MKELLHDDPKKALEIIQERYRCMHRQSGERDLAMTYDFLVKKRYAKDIAQEYHYHANTVYNIIDQVRAFTESYYIFDDMLFPCKLNVDIRELCAHSYKLLYLCMAQYQKTGGNSIRRNEIICRIPYLTRNSRMRRCVEELGVVQARYEAEEADRLPAFTEEFPDMFDVFRCIDYCKGTLRYEFSAEMKTILLIEEALKRPAKRVDQQSTGESER